jgi:pyrroline-5-carboxylate reductase
MERQMLDQTIGFVGAGQMARALAGGFVAAELVRAEQIVAFDPSEPAADQFASQVGGARLMVSNVEVIGAADIVVLAVKPQNVDAVAGEVSGLLGSERLLVSIAAGITIQRLTSGFGSDRVIRVMPNTPCLVGRGAAGYALGPGATVEDGEIVWRLLGAVGVAFQVDERMMDVVTGLSGSGPAFVYTVIEALSDGGVRMGLPRQTATSLAAQTVLGAAEMVLSSGEHPAVLRERVTSPGGTTIAGMQALENRGLRAALIGAVEAATERSVELGKG